MAILFTVVARGPAILTKYAWCGGNFLEVTEIVYLCIMDDDFERSRDFNFLNEIKKRFQTTYGSRAQTALPYAMDSEFSSVWAAQLKHHSENKGLGKVTETQAQVDELKGIMVRNVDLIQKSCPSHVYEEPQAHYHHYHHINCVHLYHWFTSLWWIYMAKLCEEIRRKKLTLTKDMREQGVKSNPCDSSPSHTDRWYLPVSSNLFSLFKILFYASRFIFV
uniref:AP-3 complex subunit delta-1 n=1 Tax=Cebus imitator TaxID=2715852 RepID=A0A2K5RRK4_CEBIM